MSIAALPVDWDLESLFPSLESEAYRTANVQLRKAIEDFGIVLESAERKSGAGELEEILGQQNRIAERIQTINAYLMGLVTTNANDEAAQKAESEFEMLLLPYGKLQTRVVAWIGTLDLDALMSQSELIKSHEFGVRKAHEISKHLMSPAEEALASDLAPTGTSAWDKLHGNVSSTMQVTVPLKTGSVTLAMSQVRNLAYEADRDVRQAAYHAELAAWKESEIPITAAMNGLKGAVGVLSKRRGWASPLDQALFGANIDRETLDAMMSAARESYPDFRRYLTAKAKALGLRKLAFYDIFAPLGSETKSWSYDEGAEFVARQFRTYSDKLSDFAENSYRKRWIDVHPKSGKRDGAYCMGVRPGESRILLNFKPSFGSVSTLAHELGHGYHNLCAATRTPLQKRMPMTLAETASIFCETIIREAGIAEGTDAERLTILEASLQGTCQVVVDISSRFLFEQSVFEKREARDLSASELCEAMKVAQLATYGDGLDEDALHPYMWAAKPHYYSTSSFYNFPYMFGLLFGLGLYAIYKREPEGFHERYDDLLSATGMADAATLGARFGIDIRSTDFWRSSLDVIRADIDKFEDVIGRGAVG